MQIHCSTYLLDPIPIKILKAVFNDLSEIILDMINSSLSSGVVPSAFKMAVVKPLLQKPNIDPTAFNNYRPISNVPFLAKVEFIS